MTVEYVKTAAQEAADRLYELMRQYADYGALDSEGIYAMDRCHDAAMDGKPFPLTGENPFELYETMPGWKTANAKLVHAAKLYWRAMIGERLGI